jgi:8-oxo-dGTP pyrophosphatase MutT (NUDIX family)
MLPTTPLLSERERSSETGIPHLAWLTQVFDLDPFDRRSRVLRLVPVSLHRYTTLLVPSLPWIPWPPLAGATRFSTFIGTMDS